MPARNTNRGGRQPGKKNYNYEVLLNVIEEVLPVRPSGWSRVAQRYQEVSKEPNLRSPEKLQKQFKKLTCLTHQKKVTGSSGPSNLSKRANQLFMEIVSAGGGQNFGQPVQPPEPLNAVETSDSEADGDEGGDLFHDPVSAPTQFMPLETDAVEDGDNPTVSAPQPNPLKRPAPTHTEENKTKNSRTSPRATAATVLNNVASSIAASSQSNQMMQMMQMMMQQQAQQAAQQQQLLMMLLMQRSTPPVLSSSSSSTALPGAPSVSSFNSGTTDSTGDVSMSSYSIAHHFD